MNIPLRTYFAKPDGAHLASLDPTLVAAYAEWEKRLSGTVWNDDSFKVRNAHMLIEVSRVTSQELAPGIEVDLDSTKESRQNGDVWDETKDGIYLMVVTKTPNVPATVFAVHTTR